jgi:hypothetical protein
MEHQNHRHQTHTHKHVSLVAGQGSPLQIPLRDLYHSLGISGGGYKTGHASSKPAGHERKAANKFNIARAVRDGEVCVVDEKTTTTESLKPSCRAGGSPLQIPPVIYTTAWRSSVVGYKITGHTSSEACWTLTQSNQRPLLQNKTCSHCEVRNVSPSILSSTKESMVRRL